MIDIEVESDVNLWKRLPDDFETQFSMKRKFDYQKIFYKTSDSDTKLKNKKREDSNKKDKNTKRYMVWQW